MMEWANRWNYMSTRHATASRCQICVRPHLSAVETRLLNAPLCLNLSCWLYGNDASQAKHNKPLAFLSMPCISVGKMAISLLCVCVSPCVSSRDTGNADKSMSVRRPAWINGDRTRLLEATTINSFSSSHVPSNLWLGHSLDGNPGLWQDQTVLDFNEHESLIQLCGANTGS